MNYNTDINKILQQFSIKPQTAVEFIDDEEFSEEVKHLFENKCCVLMDTYLREDSSALDILNAVQDVVSYLKEQYPPSSEHHEELDMILEQSNLLIDKYQEAAQADNEPIAEDNFVANSSLFGSNNNSEEDSVGNTALNVAEQLTTTYQSNYGNNVTGSLRKCSMAAVLLSVSDAMTSIGLMEAQTLAKMNDDYVKAKEAFADFQKIVTKFKTFFDNASGNSRAAGGEASATTDQMADWYAWLSNKFPIVWEEIPLPNELRNDKNFANFRDAVEKVVARYHGLDKNGSPLDETSKKEFLNMAQKNGGLDKWFRDSISAITSSNGKEFKIAWKQPLKDGSAVGFEPFNIGIDFTKYAKNMNLAFPIKASLIPDMFKNYITKPDDKQNCWLTQDNFLGMLKELARQIQSIAPNKMVTDVLDYKEPLKNIQNFGALTTWLDSPLKQLSASQDALNQKLTSINDRVRNIGNTIKDNLEKLKVVV